MNPTYLDKGDLQIFVTAGESPDPIPGARVRITDPENGAILEETVTDSSGQTPFLELPAPPVELSIMEGAAQQRPYAVYNVTSSARPSRRPHPAGSTSATYSCRPTPSGGSRPHGPRRMLSSPCRSRRGWWCCRSR